MFAFAGFFNKIRQPFLEFFRAFAGGINIRRADSAVGGGKFPVITPCRGVFSDRRDNIRRKNKFLRNYFFNNGDDGRMHQIVGAQKTQPFNIGLGISAFGVARRKPLHRMHGIVGAHGAVNPSETKRLFDRVVINNSFFAAGFFGEQQPRFGGGLKIICKPFAPLRRRGKIKDGGRRGGRHAEIITDSAGAAVIIPAMLMKRILAAAFCFAAAGAAAETVTLFSGGNLAEWEYHSFDGIAETTYRPAPDPELGGAALFAESRGGASGYILKTPLSLQKTPWLHFQWRVDEAGGGFDERKKNGDDFAFRIYFAARSGLTYKSLSLVRAQAAAGESWKSPHAKWFNDLRVVAVVGGGAARGEWQTASVNLEKLWREQFGEDAPVLGLAGIMTDGDSAGVIMRARYGAAVLSGSAAPPF